MNSLPRLRRAVLATWMVLLIAFTLAVSAQEHPNVARGLGRFGSGTLGIDSINPFNSNLTLVVPLGPTYLVGPRLSFQLTLLYNSQVWEYENLGDETNVVPARTDNAGLGWRLSLGQLMAPGASQVVDSTRWVYIAPDASRHAFFSTLHDDEPESTDFGYTRDGSYLRLNSAARTVELPDGIKHTFDTQGNLTDMSDPYGNWVHVAYAGDPVTWTITDSHGRTHLVAFKSTPAPYQQAVVDRVELAKTGGGRTTISLAYSSDGAAFATSLQPCNGNGTSLAATFLTRIDLPDGTRYAMPLSDYYTEPAPSDTTLTCRTGRIARVTLPTLGKMEWDYRVYAFPQTSTPRHPWQRATGVARRSLLNPDGTLNGESWTYTTAVNAARTEVVNTITEPSGAQVRNYFSVCTGSLVIAICALPEQLYEYGLPLSRDRPGDGRGGFLSREVVSGTSTKRSQYLAYEHDAVTATPGFDERSRLNQRVSFTDTIYNDDGSIFASEQFANFDGHGHYRARTTGGSFPGNNSRLETIGWSAGNNSSPGQPAYQPWPTASPWVLGVFSFTWTKEGTAPLRYRSYCFDVHGFLYGRRVHGTSNDSAEYSTADLVEIFAPSSRGFVEEEFYLGGDLQAVNATPVGGFICTLAQTKSFFNTAQFRIHNDYTFGARSASTYYASGSPFLRVLQQTNDPSTGLPTQITDIAGLSTALTYDATGWRLAAAQPTADAATVLTYTNAALNGSNQLANGARIKTDRLQGAVSLLQAQTEVDPWARVVSQKRTIGPQQFSEVRSIYDAQQRLEYVSVAGMPGSGTTIKAFDAFGRPTQIRPPDGSAHDVFVSYAGARSTARTVKIATGASETPATTVETFDRFGRLYEVLEPNGVRTRYGYDVDGNLTRVCQNANETATTCGQQRLFTYDTRGLLLSESHPEKTSLVTYSAFDARGRPTHRVDGASNLTFTFDRADRLTRISEPNPAAVPPGSTQRTLKSFSYSSSNGNFTDPLTNQVCFSYGQGKLAQQSRFNYVALFDTAFTVELREGFTYCGREGRMSRRSLDNYVNGAVTPNESFALPNVTYDGVGQVTSLDYPRCTHAACNAPSPRTLTYDYSFGLLNAVGIPNQNGSYASSITYHPSLMVNQVVHNNNPADATKKVTDTYGPEASGIGRPASIKAQNGAVTRWDTGTYAYDGTGNVKAAGAHTFTYDTLGRLGTASIYLEPTAPATTLRTQSYEYDIYGNIQKFLGSSGLTTTTLATNNQLQFASYDASGNMIGWNGNSYAYDPFGLVWDYETPTAEWAFFYTADDERAWAYKTDNTSLWTLRGIDGKTLREYSSGGTWAVQSDYIYRDGRLLATETPSGVRHFHLDHLGTPRLITNALGQQSAYHVYYPFGEEATTFGQDSIREKFTGHERDLGNLGGADDDLDYMHARHFNPLLGRFLSTDPVRGTPGVPQSFNLFSYVRGNPLKYVDRDGRWVGFYSWARATDGAYTESISVTTAGNPLAGLGALLSGRALLDALSLGASVGWASEWFSIEPDNFIGPCAPVSYGLTVDVSTINPFSSGGGGSYGWNLEYVPESGMGLYSFSSPTSSDSAGFDVGASATVNVAGGNGAWTGDFLNAVGSLFFGTGGGFGTPAAADSGVGWHGVQAGATIGFPAGAGTTVTNYKRRADLSFLHPWCR